MGRTLVDTIIQDKEVDLVGAIERTEHPDIAKDMGEVLGKGFLGIKISSNLAEVIKGKAVLMDFTQPEASMENLRIARTFKLPAVIGTTGFSEEQKGQIERISEDIPCVLSPNMSIGINLMFKLIQEAAKILGKEYDVEVLEIHHKYKKDVPSGTALRLAEILSEALGWDFKKAAVLQRKGERGKEEIGIQSLRAGDLVGDHTVIFGGIGERLEIIHRLQSRESLAKGAIKAAKWIANKEKGLYDMQDVLGIK